VAFNLRSKNKLLGQGSQKLEHEQYKQTDIQTNAYTDRQADGTKHITTSAFAGGSKMLQFPPVCH